MHIALLILHILGTVVWVGGSVVLVFVVIPASRGLEGEARRGMLRTIGRRWRPIGWGALAVLVVSGLGLAGEEHAFGAHVLFGTGTGRLVLAKGVLAGVLIAVSAVHDFVLSPRLARQIREGRPLGALRPLVRFGWTSLSLSVVLPILGVLLAELPLD